MQREQTRILLSNLVGLTLIAERIAGDPETDPSHLIQLSQSIRGLLSELGLSPRADAKAPADLASYLRDREPTP
jgi:hypothetical protein